MSDETENLSEDEINRRANEKNRKRKEARDKMLATKTIEKGLIIVHTGTGKGKSTAAFGLALRALGNGFNLVYAQHFLTTLRHKAIAKLSTDPGLFDAARVRAARTLREFDDCVTAPLRAESNKLGMPDYAALWAGQAYPLATAERAGDLIARWMNEAEEALKALR